MDVTTLLETLLAGIVGTFLMSVSMAAIHATGWANADMIRAIGSLVTRKVEGAFQAGLALHFTAGMLFAIPYTFVLGNLSQGGWLMTLGLGLLMGIAHGIIMAMVLLTVGSQRHPLEQFRGAGFEVGVAHLLGHAVYGVGVAAVVALLHIRWTL